VQAVGPLGTGSLFLAPSKQQKLKIVLGEKLYLTHDHIIYSILFVYSKMKPLTLLYFYSIMM